jgi:hypothetical protein
MKNRSSLLAITLFVCSVFLNTSPRTMSNSTQQVGYITVSGHYEYWDNNGNLQPTVWGRIWVCDRNPEGDRILTDINGNSEYFTDAYGNFCSGPIENNDGADDGLDITVYIVTWNWAVQVFDSDVMRYHFGVYSEDWNNLTDGTHIDFSVEGVPSNQIGAWIIFSYHCGIAAGWNYIQTQTGYEMAMASACWPCGDWPGYDPNNGVIYLTDWSAWYPDVILHEYGHYVMHTLYGYMPTPPGGPPPENHINETSNNVTAWVEGWANFFPLVVFNDPVLEDPWSSTNLETPHWCSPNWDDGDEVEGRVAGALWDIFDPQNDNAPWYYDSFSDGFTRIWNIMETTPCDTFHEFWQAWNTSGYPKQPALMAIFQNSIDYRGPGDVNGDCSVDMTDISLAIDAFMTEKGDDEWDQRCDMNYDDWIDMVDISFIIDYYMTTYDC